MREPETKLDADATEFRKALAHLYPELLRYARRLSRNHADAQDLVHDALERGLRRRALFRTGDPGRWMITILRHVFLDGCRRATRWKEIAPAYRHLYQQPEMTAAGVDPAGLNRDARRASEAYTVDDVRRAVPFVKPALGEVFCLYTFDRLSQREIGRRLGLPVSTVGTRLLRARRQLREILEVGPPRRAPALRQRRPALALAA